MMPLLVHGMHGLGDNLHQRAVLRQLMERHEIWLESSWVAPYFDLIGQGLRVIRKPTSLRTQAKNAERERSRFHQGATPRFSRALNVWYRPEEVRASRSVLGAMCRNTGTDIERADFRLPVPNEWIARARAVLDDTIKPVLVYRPLVERTEWSGCAARNPDHVAYAQLYNSIRGLFHVVSIADLVAGKEWMTGLNVEVDQRFHAGELDFEALAGLFAVASMTFCSPGFSVILSQAVGTPVVCAFGSYESSYSFSPGARFAPYLGIDPITPCDDFKHDDTRDKSIDVPAAIAALAAFAANAAAGRSVAA
jgi:ADP-heptose:LPS heptosyltransferase